MSRSASRTVLGFVSDSVYPWNTGGKEKRHHELLTRLTRRGYDVRVYTMKWWDGPSVVVREGITYVAISPRLPLYSGTRRSVRQALVFAVCCLSLLWRRFDVLEVDSIPFLPLLPARVVATVRRVPMVTTWHEFWGRDYWVRYLGLPGHLAAWVERTAIRLPHRIIAASDGTAERLHLAGEEGTVDVHVIPNGIDRTASVEPRPGRRDGTELISVGRLLENKKIDLAVEATHLSRTAGSPLTLRVIGEGPEEPALRRLVDDLGAQEAVTFSPFLEDHDDVLQAISDADLLVFPSVREGFGMVALEAMSVGTPVVTSDHPDNFARHLVEPGVNGELYSGTAASLSDAIGRALVRRDELGTQARATAARFDWEALADSAALAYRF